MQDILRESMFGQAVNRASKGKYFPYPEDRPTFQVPPRFVLAPQQQPSVGSEKSALDPSPQNDSLDSVRICAPKARAEDIEQQLASDSNAHTQETIVRDLHADKEDLHESKDPNLVEWYSDDDPDNPQNWSNGRKVLLVASSQLLNFSIYIGATMFAPAIPGVMAEFGVSHVKATLGISLYVLAYGLGPMVFSPLSEIPRFGRLSVYMITLFLFVVLQIPTVLATDYTTIMITRFLAGFVCAPALSTGVATLADVFKPMSLPYAISVYSAASGAAPVFGPVTGGYAAQLTGWRTPLYILLGLSSLTCVVLFFLFPETSADAILLRRARRLRKLTGNTQLKSKSEMDHAQLSFSEVLSTALLRPFVLFLEPVVALLDVYMALVYAIFYLWFEAFPLVFTGIYRFSLGASGLPFLGFIVALIPTLVGFILYQRFVVIPKFKKTGVLVPESRLKVALVGSFFIPFALVIFGWTAREDLRWMGPVVGASLYFPGIYFIFQGICVYLPMSYTRYAASVLAGNNLLRSAMAAVFPLFGRSLFTKITVGGGCSLLAGISAFMIIPLWLLCKYGARVRQRSKFATY